MEGRNNATPMTPAARRDQLAEALGTRGSRKRSSRLRVGNTAASGGSGTATVAVASAGASAGANAPPATDRPAAGEGQPTRGRTANDVSTAVDDAASAPAHRELARQVRALSARVDLTRAELIDALVRFDVAEAWRVTGARSCTDWMVAELGYSRASAYQHLKVGRELARLPVLAELFRAGELSWSKIVALVRVATPEDERALAVVATEHDADTLARLLEEYRWGREAEADAKAAAAGGPDAAAARERERGRERAERRYLRVARGADGSGTLAANLPAERMTLVAEVIERIARRLYDKAKGTHPPGNRPTLAQCRADALELMAKAALTGEADGTLPAAAEPLVVAVVDHAVLEPAIADVAAAGPDSDAPLPLPVRCAVVGILGSSITPAKARQLACEGSLMTVLLKGGEPVAMGRKVRLHTKAQRRAAAVRDGHRCSFPGCNETHGLQPHHVWRWGKGGSTDVASAAMLCEVHHARVHDEEWTVTPALPGTERPAVASTLLEGADERTRRIVAALDARRPRFGFVPPDRAAPDIAAGSGRVLSDALPTPEPDRCRESAGRYVIKRARSSRPRRGLLSGRGPIPGIRRGILQS